MSPIFEERPIITETRPTPVSDEAKRLISEVRDKYVNFFSTAMNDGQSVGMQTALKCLNECEKYPELAVTFENQLKVHKPLQNAYQQESAKLDEVDRITVDDQNHFRQIQEQLDAKQYHGITQNDVAFIIELTRKIGIIFDKLQLESSEHLSFTKEQLMQSLNGKT